MTDKSTHAQKQREYVQRKREQLGEDEFLKVQAEKKRQQREKTDKSSSGREEGRKRIDDLMKLLAETKSKQDKPLQPSSIMNYATKLNRVCIAVTDHAFSGDFNFLKDADKVYEKLKEQGLKSIKDYLSVCSKIAQHYNMGEDQIKKYQAYMAEEKEKEYAIRKDNMSSEKEKENAMKLKVVNKKIDDYVPKTDQDLAFLLVVKMYFQNELIPRNNLADFKLVSNSKKISTMNPMFNYILMDKDKPTMIVMKRYKTQQKYGTQKFGITHQLEKTLAEFIKRFDRKNGEFLFQTTVGEPFTKAQSGELVRRATREVLGLPMNVNLIRKIHVTDHYSHGLKSINENEEFARRLLHSAEVGQEYAKKDLFDGIDSDDKDE